MKIFLLIILFCQSSFAQKNLSKENFQVNVRPALSGILNDFYQMVALFPNFPQGLGEIIRDMDDLTQIKDVLRSQCPRLLTLKCTESIEELRNKLSDLQRRILKLQAQQSMSSGPHLSTLGGLRTIYEFQAELERVKGSLDNSSFLLRAKIPDRNETFSVIRSLDELSTYLSLTVVEFIPYLYREDFRNFFFNFIHPIELQISKNHNYEFLNRNVEALNFNFNLLNMNLTKRNKKTPEGMGPYLNTLHNRWNSILRFYY